jgi:hypothetical protein
MKFPWSRGQPNGTPARRPPQDEQAYLLLEEARLRCLRLCEEALTRARRRQLEVAYREIGMAGYMASSRIPSDRRRRLLWQAHERSRASAREPSRTSAREPSRTSAREPSRERAREGSAPGGDQRLRDIEHRLSALVALVNAAAGAVDRALVAPGITDHVQSASEHLGRARLALGDLLASPLPAPSALPS